MFFLVIEPLNNTSCYADSCLSEIQHYIESKYIFISMLNLIQLTYFSIFKRIKRPVVSDTVNSLQDKFIKMMESVEI